MIMDRVRVVMSGLVAVTVVAALALAIGGARGSNAIADVPAGSELASLPPGLDSASTLSQADASVAACSVECVAIVYAWTPRMPLSRAAIPGIARAAERLDARLTLVAYEELAAYAPWDGGVETPSIPLADEMLAAGALAHAPSVVVARGGSIVGPAILGYKTEEAYEAAISRRIATAPGAAADQAGGIALEPTAATAPLVRRRADYRVVGVPGAYFRWVPGRNAVAYEANQRVYLLDLADGQSRLAPGFIDFVPTPDGRYFVTPGEVEGGLTFYDADQVFEAVGRGRPGEAEPIFTDLRMRDQYPSVGILEQNGTRTLYRVMTSWFEGVVYRDYDVRVDARSGASSVQPVGEPIRPCADVRLSTPIMSQDGQSVAGRDEATGTTKVFRILGAGRCEALTDFGVPSSKVAWHSTGRKVAFSIPRRRRAGDEGEQGIFVLDLDGRDLVRLPTSEGASRLAFPDFVGDEAVVFLVPGQGAREPSVFRVVDLAPQP
jgi:hypothetical protein